MTKAKSKTVVEPTIETEDNISTDVMPVDDLSVEIPLNDGVPAISSFNASGAYSRFDDEGRLFIDCATPEQAQALRDRLKG